MEQLQCLFISMCMYNEIFCAGRPSTQIISINVILITVIVKEMNNSFVQLSQIMLFRWLNYFERTEVAKRAGKHREVMVNK